VTRAILALIAFTLAYLAEIIASAAHTFGG
jgi:hypothetical protein